MIPFSVQIAVIAQPDIDLLEHSGSLYPSTCFIELSATDCDGGHMRASIASGL